MVRRGYLIAGWVALAAAGCSDDPAGLPVNAVCTTNKDCADGICHSYCMDPNPGDEGKPCEGKGNCKSANCQGGVCARGIAKAGGKCLYSEECLHGHCSPYYKICGDKGPDGGAPDAGKPDAKKQPDAKPADTAPPDKAPPPDMPPADKTAADLAPPDASPLCGNGKLDPTEVCDGKLLGGKTCKTQGFTGGVLECHDKTCTLDQRGCYTIGAAVTLSNDKSPGDVALTGTAKGFHVAWGDSPLQVVPVSFAGTPGTKITVAASGSYPAVCTNGLDFLVAWSGLYVTTVSAAGKVKIPPLSAGVGSYPALAYDGTNYLVLLINGGGVDGRLVNTSGIPQGSVSTITSSGVTNGVSKPAVAFDGTRYLAVWTSGLKPAAHGRFVDQKGTPAATTHTLESGGSSGLLKTPEVAFGGGRYLVVWEDARVGQDITGAMLDTQGNLVHKTIPVAAPTVDKEWLPKVTYTAGRFLVAWINDGTSGRHFRGVQVYEDEDKTKPPIISPQITLLTLSFKAGIVEMASVGEKTLLVWRTPSAKGGLDLIGVPVTFGK